MRNYVVGEMDVGELMFDGVYQCAHQYYSSYPRFFADGKVAGVSSTGTPNRVVRWLNHDYETNGFYTIEKDIVRLEITSVSGSICYCGRILGDGVIANRTDFIY